MGTRGPIANPLRVVNNHHGSKAERERRRRPLGTGRRLTPPKWITSEARRIWKRLEPQVRKSKLTTEADRDSFGRLCVVQSLFERATSEAAELDSLVTENVRGGAKSHPILKTITDTASLLARLSADFGLTPPGRARLHVQPEEPAETDGVHEFLFGSPNGQTDPRNPTG